MPKQRIRHRIELELRSYGRKGWHIYGHGEQEEKVLRDQDYASTFGELVPSGAWAWFLGKAWNISGIVTLTGDMRLANDAPTRLRLLGPPGCLQGSKR